jgi:hypothetical protein
MRSTPSADRSFGRAIRHLFFELARRAVAQRLVRVHRIVLLEPAAELAEHGCRIGTRADPRIIALEGLHKGFGHAVIRHHDFGALVFGPFLREKGFGEPIRDTGRRECSWSSPTQAVARVLLRCGLRRIQLAVTLLDPSGAEMALHHDPDMVRAIVGARQVKFLFGPARSQGQDTIA